MQVLFYTHILFMAIMAALVISAAVTAHRKKAAWFPRHRLLALSGVMSALLAFLAVLIFKTVMQYPHLKSPHAMFGLISLALLSVTPVVGSMIAKGPKGIRAVHRALGRITVIVVLATAVMGVLQLIQIFSR